MLQKRPKDPRKQRLWCSNVIKLNQASENVCQRSASKDDLWDASRLFTQTPEKVPQSPVTPQPLTGTPTPHSSSLEKLALLTGPEVLGYHGSR